MFTRGEAARLNYAWALMRRANAQLVAALVAVLVMGCSRTGTIDSLWFDVGATTSTLSGGVTAGAGGASSGSDGSTSEVGSGAGSGTGMPTTSTGPGASTSASGGPITACTKLVQTGDLVTIPTVQPGSADNARFHRLDDTRVAVAHRPFDSVLGLRLGSTTVTWTDAWPPTSDAPVTLLENAGLSFAVDRGPELNIGLLTPPPMGTGISFGVVDPAVGGWQGQASIDLTADRAVFSRRGLGEYFVGTTTPGPSPGPSSQLRVGWYDGKDVRGPYNAGCSSALVMADALALPAGWLLARTTSSVATCSAFSPAPPPQNITVDLIVGDMPLFGAEIPFGGQTSQLALVPRQEGAWLLHWFGPSTLMGLALDGVGHIAFGPTALVTLKGPSFAFAADPLDDGLALALYDAPESAPAALVILVTNALGAPIASAALFNPPKPTTAPQLLFDAKTRQLLLGFSGLDAGKQSLYLARFACE